MVNQHTSIRRCILYYPFLFPSSQWLKQMLLYWDAVGSIIPEKYQKAPNFYPASIQLLIDEDVFKPFRPEEINFDMENRERLDDEFTSIVLSASFKRELRRKNIYETWKTHPRGSVAIHIDKMTWKAHKHLEVEGLVHQETYFDEYIVERTVGYTYLSLLAKYLAKQHKDYTITGTHFPEFNRLAYFSKTDDNSLPCIVTRYENILPIPGPDVSFEKILEFKRSHLEELNQFRKTLTEFQRNLSEAQSGEAVKEISVSFAENIATGVKNLDEAMKDARIARTWSTFRTFTIPTAWASWASVMPQLLSSIATVSLAAFGILLTAGTAIEVGSNLIDRNNLIRSDLRNSPFSYLYHAQQDQIASFS